jgi:hypothetical protein
MFDTFKFQPWTNSASISSLADRYDNPIPSRFLVPIDCLKIPALRTGCLTEEKRVEECICVSALSAGADTTTLLVMVDIQFGITPPGIRRTTDERVQIDWQRPLSGVHFIIMVNSAQPGECGCTALHALLPFNLYRSYPGLSGIFPF